MRWYGLLIDIEIVDFDLLVPVKYRVWGKGYTQKLSLKANYLRFYAPEIMSTKYGARSFLYLDSDTLFVNSGLLKLFSTPSPNAWRLVFKRSRYVGLAKSSICRTRE
jgi:lipopolysaccharide biosynthesis glycosyltransferase